MPTHQNFFRVNACKTSTEQCQVERNGKQTFKGAKHGHIPGRRPISLDLGFGQFNFIWRLQGSKYPFRVL